MAIRTPRSSALVVRTRAFTLLEVALIVAIIGMMLMIIVGYLMAPKQTGPLPPVAAPTPILPSSTPVPATPTTILVPAPSVSPAAPPPHVDAVPTAPAASTPAPLPAFR